MTKVFAQVGQSIPFLSHRNVVTVNLASLLVVKPVQANMTMDSTPKKKENDFISLLL
jgi:hypothetical protein